MIEMHLFVEMETRLGYFLCFKNKFQPPFIPMNIKNWKDKEKDIIELIFFHEYSFEYFFIVCMRA